MRAGRQLFGIHGAVARLLPGLHLPARPLVGSQDVAGTTDQSDTHAAGQAVHRHFLLSVLQAFRTTDYCQFSDTMASDFSLRPRDDESSSFARGD